MKRERIIEPLLLHGEQSATYGRDLCAITGYTARNLRAQVAWERKDGALILSSDNGYFLPDEDEHGITPAGYAEIERFYSRIRSMAISCFTSGKVARLTLKEGKGGSL